MLQNITWIFYKWVIWFERVETNNICERDLKLWTKMTAWDNVNISDWWDELLNGPKSETINSKNINLTLLKV